MTDHARIRQAVDRLAGALSELGYTDRFSIKPAIRILLAPGEPTTADAPHMHSIGLTPELAELLAEAAEQLILHRCTAGEPDDSINAVFFALAKPNLAAEIDSAFDGIDIAELTRTLQHDSDHGEDGTE